MVEVYSPPGQEAEIADLLLGEMKGLGFQAAKDAVGNVVGRLAGGRPRVLLCGHMDTVPNLLPAKVEGGVLYGRGAVDAKAPLAAMVVAASQLSSEGYGGELIVVGAVDEEGKGAGVKHLIEEGLDVDYAIFGEPTNADTVTVGYKGSLLLKVTCRTETGHSSAPWLFENAAERAYEVWGLLRDLEMPQERKESPFHSLSKCLRRIQGGGEGSVVPSSCEVWVDFRIPPSLTVDQILGEARRLVEGYASARPRVRVEVEVEDSTEPYLADKRSPLVRALSQAIWRVRGAQVRLVNKTGTGDMNVFGRATGRPTATYGPGDPHLDHTPNEHIALTDYLDSIEVLKEALRRLSQLHGGDHPRKGEDPHR